MKVRHPRQTTRPHQPQNSLTLPWAGDNAEQPSATTVAGTMQVSDAALSRASFSPHNCRRRLQRHQRADLLFLAEQGSVSLRFASSHALLCRLTTALSSSWFARGKLVSELRQPCPVSDPCVRAVVATLADWSVVDDV